MSIELMLAGGEDKCDVEDACLTAGARAGGEVCERAWWGGCDCSRQMSQC